MDQVDALPTLTVDPKVRVTVLDGLRVFASGALIEAGCVCWVHFSERHRAVPTAVCSMLIATAQVSGIGGSLRDLRLAVLFVLGYGVGTWCAVTFLS